MALDVFEDIPDTPSEDGLGRLKRMFDRRSKLNDRREELEAELKVVSEELRGLDEKDFPELFDEVGVTSFSVGNFKVSIEEKLYGGLPKDELERTAAFDIIKSNGGESIIKAEVSVAFDKGSAGEAKSVADNLRAMGLNPLLAETVHPSTLNKWAREALEAGRMIDLKALGLYQRRFVKVK